MGEHDTKAKGGLKNALKGIKGKLQKQKSSGAKERLSESNPTAQTALKPAPPEIKNDFIDIIENVINAKLQEFAMKLLKTLEKNNSLDMCANKINGKAPNLAEDIKAFMNKERPFSLEETKKLYKDMETVILANQQSAKAVDPSRLPSFNSATRAVQSMGTLYNYDISTYAELLNKTYTLQEEGHKQSKRKMPDFIKKIKELIHEIIPLLKDKSDQKRLKKLSNKMGATNKAVEKFVVEKIVTVFNSSAQNHLALLKADFEHRDNADTIHLNGTKKVQQESVSLAQKASKAASIAYTGAAFGAQVLSDPVQAASSIKNWVSGEIRNVSPGLANYLQGFQSQDPNVLRGNLGEQLEHAFEQEAKMQAFGSGVKLIQQMYGIYETKERMNQNHPGIHVDFAQIGFGRMNEPEFKVFLTSLGHSLGFDDLDGLDTKNIIQKIYYADDSTLQKASERYITADESTGIGPRASSTLMSKEHEKVTNPKSSKQKKSVSSNYNLLIDMNKQLIESLHSKSRSTSIITKGLKKVYKENGYNPNAKGVAASLEKAVHGIIATDMKGWMNKYLEPSNKIREEVTNLGELFSDNIESKFSDILNDYYAEFAPKNSNTAESFMQSVNIESSWQFLSNGLKWCMGSVDQEPDAVTLSEDLAKVTNRTPKKGSTTNVSEREKQWDNAEQKSEKIVITKPVQQSLVELAKSKTEKEWRSVASDTLTMIQSMNITDLDTHCIEHLEKAMTKMKENGTRDEAIDEQVNKIRLLQNAFDSDMSKDHLKSLSFDELIIVYDGLQEATGALYKDSKHQDFRDQADLFMIQKTLSDVRFAYATPEMALSLYEEVYETHFDTIGEKSSDLSNQIVGKVSQAMQMYLNTTTTGSLDQMKHYAEQRALKAEHKTKEAPAEPTSQGWLSSAYSWASNAATKTYNAASTAASYLGYVYTPIKAVSSFSFDVMVGYAKDNIAGVAFDTPESLNNALTNFCKESLRKEAFNAGYNMCEKMTTVIEELNKLPKNERKAVYKELGLGDEKTAKSFVVKLSGTLGYDRSEFTNPIRRNALKEQKGEAFQSIPQTAEERYYDPFVTFKQTVGELNKEVTERAQSKNSSNDENYLVMISSLSSIVQGVEKGQRITNFLELAPDIDEKLGFDPSQANLMAQLKKASRDRIQSGLEGQLTSNIVQGVTDSIDRSTQFANGLLELASERTKELTADMEYEAVMDAMDAYEIYYDAIDYNDYAKSRAAEYDLLNQQDKKTIHSPENNATMDSNQIVIDSLKEAIKEVKSQQLVQLKSFNQLPENNTKRNKSLTFGFDSTKQNNQADAFNPTVRNLNQILEACKKEIKNKEPINLTAICSGMNLDSKTSQVVDSIKVKTPILEHSEPSKRTPISARK